MLKKALSEVLGPSQINDLFSGFDQIGNVIVIRIPDSLISKKRIIGKTLLDKVKTARSVFYQSSDVRGDFRIRDLELLAGEDSTETEYKENGCRFMVDVEKTFFSPRLSTERERIANLVTEGEVIVNMFAGIGIFSIMIAKQKKCTVYSIDINPIASKLCEKNISRNKLKGTVISINGDAAKQIIEKQLENKSDRTLMLLPERSDEFLNSAIYTTKDQGVIHYYLHQSSPKKQQVATLASQHYKQITPVKSKILDAKIVRAIGPRYYQAVVDVKITK
jgi:tRNA (guanine37-N1)-methyltransferase